MLWIVACICLLLATIGSFWAVSLLLYSPTKLARRMRKDIDCTTIEELQQFGPDYQVLARILALGGLLCSALLLTQATGSIPDRFWLVMPCFVAVAILLCGVLPTHFAETQAEVIVQRSYPALRVLRLLLRYPLLLPFLYLARGLSWVLRIKESPVTEPEEIAEEILTAVSDSAHETQLPEEEKGWIENIIELKDQHASEVMTPRTDMLALSEETPILQAVRKAIDTGYSRYPVYRGKVDKVVGVFYAKDALSLIGNGKQAAVETVGELMRKPLFVPDTIGLADLLAEFRSSKVQMAIVLDEYGGTDGLVTIEDILEEIVGDISDEYDPEEEEQIKVIEVGRVIETSGRVRVEDVNEVLSATIPEGDDYETVAGFVFCALDRIPRVMETIELEGLEIRILRADDRRIRRMRLRRLDLAPSQG
ncbi:MAG: hemolysin family protein [Planctomycetota bacterium]